MQAFDFTNRTVFVAGGTSGINLGIAEAFAETRDSLSSAARRHEWTKRRRLWGLS
jgi:NAD(P)-dependent dehydrogenase (short-subunit alcohol dehydrogenase family)